MAKRSGRSKSRTSPQGKGVRKGSMRTARKAVRKRARASTRRPRNDDDL